MENSKIITAPECVDRWNARDEDDEYEDVSMSDEEILRSFLMDGCDVDGTPLQLAPEHQRISALPPTVYTLH